MSFFKNVLQVAATVILSTLSAAVKKVSTFLVGVTLVGQKPVALKELMISKYNDFKFFVCKSVHRKINDSRSAEIAHEQNEFLLFFMTKIHQLPFMRCIKRNVAKNNIDEMISIKHYLAVGKGGSPNFSYHMDTCALNILDKDKDIKRNI